MGRIHHAAAIALVVVSLAAVCLAQDSEYVSELKQPTGIPGNVGFGSTVALSPTGNTLAVGMPLAASNGKSATGSVGVYARTGSGWEFVINLAFSTAPAEARMGLSITLTDDKLIAAAPEEAKYTGAIYFFTLGTTSWAEEGKFAGAAEKDYFGSSVATDGVILLVGAYGRTDSQGVVLVFTLSAGKWAPSSITLSTNVYQGQLGFSLSLGTGIALVGAPGVRGYSGRAYAWSRDGNQGFSQTPSTVVTKDDLGQEVYLGMSVTVISDNFIALSTYEQGIYLFTWEASGWKQSEYLSMFVGATETGVSMSSSALFFMVGSTGKAFLYAVSGTTLPSSPKELKSLTAQSSGYGISVATAGNVIVVGENKVEIDTSGVTVVDAKSVHSFTVPDKPTSLQAIGTTGTSKSQGLGHQVAFMNGMALISVPFCVDSSLNRFCDGGYALSFTKTTNTWKFDRKIRNPYRNRDNMFGNTLEVSGNFVIVSAPHSTYVDKDIGVVVFYEWDKNKSVFVKDSIIRYRKLEEKYALGSSISNIGDITAIGMPEFDFVELITTTNYLNAGAVHIYTKNLISNKWGQRKTITSSVPTTNEGFGHSVVLLGKTKVAVSNNPPSAAAQTVYIYDLDSDTGNWVIASTILNGSKGGFGWKIGILEDKSLCISAYKDSDDAGSLVIFKSTDLKYESPIILKPSVRIKKERFGYSFSTDGTRLVIGAKPCDNTNPSCGVKGAVYTFTKNAKGDWAQQYRFVSTVADGSDGYGHDVAVSGDTVLVSAPLKNVDELKGEVYFIQK